MKSRYQDKKFADYWNKRAGEKGQVYKRLVLDPMMFNLVGNMKGKTILELGCGNGYLGPLFVREDPKKVIMMDISRHNLEHARDKVSDKRVEFLEQDATVTWKMGAESVDIVYSNMMLNEVENIKMPIKESYRVLVRGGVFVFSVTHPCWDLYVYAHEKAGVETSRIRGLGGYFRRGYAKLILGPDSRSGSSKQAKEGFEVSHYQRPISDYLNQLIEVGFTIKRVEEPELTEQLLKKYPGYSKYKDHPIGLTFLCEKTGMK